MKEINDGRNEFELSTGRKFSAVARIIGLGRDRDGRLAVTSGCDDSIYTDGIEDYESGYYDGHEPWTPAERQELAEFMIALWREFANENAIPPQAGDE